MLLIAVSAFAKMYEQPRSFLLKDKSQEQVERKALPTFDADRLIADDRARGKSQQNPGPQRFAIGAEVAYNTGNSGTWQDVSDGRLWRLRIQSPSAKSLNLGFTRYEMPEGAKLWIYDPAHARVEGPYTSKNRSSVGSLWTPTIAGNEIVVELFVPTGVAQPAIEITRVNQGYYGGTKGGLFGQSEGSCEIDEICPQGDPWRNQIQAVAVYTISNTAGGGACTGTLMNDTAHDFKPYFLSANHCLEDSGDPASLVVYWNFFSPTCGAHGPGSLADTQTGATLVANYDPSDFALFELSTTPDPSFNVWYAGWDATGVAPPSVVCIHHPEADVKDISLSSVPPQSADWTTMALSASGNHWQVDWSNMGVTEPGSSGSCIFSTDTQRCIGQLHGGPSACGASAADLHDFYGKFSVSWIGGGTPATRLMDWLDPGSTGALTLDGDPHITTANGVHYDFQGAGEYIAYRDPDGLEIQTRQTPIATTFFPGPSAYDGLATCVSLNTAVAARVAGHRVTYEPNLSGVPDPSGLQLRIDGVLTTLGSGGRNLGGGGSVQNTAAAGGLEINFPDTTALFVTPNWWASQNKWYLNVDIAHAPASDGAAGAGNIIEERKPPARAREPFAAGGLAGAIASGSWLPALPNGTTVGAMPATLAERYAELYKKFGQAWRVTDKDSLFDYAPGTSTGTFTMLDWPLEAAPCTVPNSKPAEPVSQAVAERACRGVTGQNDHANCVFDVVVTGNTGFATTYTEGQRVQSESTRTTVTADLEPTQIGEWVTFTATVTPISLVNSGVPAGRVQFLLDGASVGPPENLDAHGRASWDTDRLKFGEHEVSAVYIPNSGAAFFGSTSLPIGHIVTRCPCATRDAHK
ncbi:MAG: Ig-like domain repeat protein [Candidatus Acidiferrum sp.]